MTAPAPIISIVDDDPVSLLMVGKILSTAGYQTRSYGSAAEFLAAIDPSAAGCLLLDIHMPEMSGPELQQELRRRGANVPIIILSGTADVPVAVEVMKLGAIDLLIKPVEPSALLDRVERALAMQSQTRRRQDAIDAIRALAAQLTPRERQVMDLAVAGLANKQIAAQLQLSEKTVEVHRSHVMQKMRAQSFAELVRMAVMCQSTQAA